MARDGPTAARLTDAEIVKKLRASDVEGLRALLEYHGPVARALLTRRHGPHIAADALNRATLLVWQEFSTTYTEGKGSLCGWFLQIAHNKAIDIRRGESRKRFLQLDHDPSYDPAACDEKPYLVEKTENGQDRERRKRDIRAIVTKLPRVQRIVTECDLLDASGEAGIEVIRNALDNPNASKGSVYTARSKARATIRDEMIRLRHFPDDAGRPKNG